MIIEVVVVNSGYWLYHCEDNVLKILWTMIVEGEMILTKCKVQPAHRHFPHPRVKLSIVKSLRDREVACLASDRQGSNFESCVQCHLIHLTILRSFFLAQFSLYVHKGGLRPDSFHFISFHLHTGRVNLWTTFRFDPLIAVKLYSCFYDKSHESDYKLTSVCYVI